MLKLIWWLQVTMVLSAPLQLPLLRLQGTMQQQQMALQEQMLALQQFQAMQRINVMPTVPMIPPQPLLIIFPNNRPNSEDNRFTKLNENALKNEPQSLSEGIEDEDTDSVTIDAEEDNEIRNDNNNNLKAVLLMPNSARFSIGSVISAIPFLPFEINVPDSIAWIYNGISGIISGIGQSWPFRPNSGDGANVKSNWNRLKMKELPIVVIPLGQPLLPMQY